MNTVSIILPVKNVDRWIEKTLISIQQQTYHDWELIIVDDHSEDRTLDILKVFAEEQPDKIKIYRNPGSGIIPALQCALSKSSGKYITRIDGDDLMPKDRLNLHVEKLNSSPNKAIVTGKVKYFHENEVSEGYLKYEKWLNERTVLNDHFKHIYRECVIASPNWMCYRQDLLKYKLFESLEYPEDYDLVLKWYQYNFEVLSVNDITLLWREHPDRTSRISKYYQQKAFFELKTKRLLEKEYRKPGTIGIIGKGQKANLCAAILKRSEIPYKQYNDPNKLQELTYKSLDILLIAVYPEGSIFEIENHLKTIGYTLGENAWFV